MYLPEEKDYEKYWACDIEGDGLPSNTVWCVVCTNVKTGQSGVLRSYGDIREWFVKQQQRGDKFVFHNGIGYDAPTLNRVCGTKLTINDLVDTMLMSMVFSPSMEGGHSLENWGRKLNFPKGDFDDFSEWSAEMETYCANDAELCRRVFVALNKRMRSLGFTSFGLEIEHRSWQLIQKQKVNGFAFNISEAHVLYTKIKQKEKELAERIHDRWPPVLEHVRTFSKAYLKDGTFSKGYLTHVEQYERLEVLPDGRYNAYDRVHFSIGSPKQRVEKLLEAGWKPREFTKPSKFHPNGQPQATSKGQLSPSLLEFIEDGGPEEARLIAEWIDYNSRGNMINTWIEAYDEKTGCIHGSLWLANTLRYKHSNPNTANIPAVRLRKTADGEKILFGEAGVYTYEARDLWTTRDPKTRCLVGVDAKGIQLRVLAQYLKNKEFTDAVLGGDPHSYNQEIGGFATRATAKTFIYAYLLGAGDAKIGQIIGGSTRDGREIKKRFVSNFAGLKSLLDSLESEVERTGRIRLCDGTPIIVSQPHTRLGYLLQGDESRLMKQANILADREVRRRGLDILKVGDIHDEWQNDCLNEHAQEFAFSVCPDAFARSGNSLGYSIAIACDSRIGMTWAETH